MEAKTIRESVSYYSEVTCRVDVAAVAFLFVTTILGILILSLILFPIWAVWLNTESLLLIVQQPPCVARYVSVATVQSSGSSTLDVAKIMTWEWAQI